MPVRPNDARTLVSGVPGRFRTLVGLHPELFDGRTVLDIGARDDRLRTHAPPSCRVVTLDLQPGPAIGVVANLAGGLPFAAESFDTVLALDVLEHVDLLLDAFEDVLRVARRNAVIALPNVYEFSSRFRFLAGRPMSSKYRLSDGAARGGDRHRWVYTPGEAVPFLRRHAAAHGFAVFDLRFLTLGYTSAPMRAVQSVAERLQMARNLMGGTVVFYLERDQAPTTRA